MPPPTRSATAAIAIPPTAKFATTARRSPIDRPSAAFVGAWVAITAPASVAAVSAMMRSMRSLLGGGRAPHASSATDGPGMQEALVAWVLWGLVALGVWETYARFPAAELYNVTGTGFAAGAARTLVFLSWPVAIAAVALVVVAADRLLAGSIPGWGRAATVLAATAAIVLCATIALPGALDPNDLDARAANVPAAVGVLLALLVTLAAVGVRGTGRRAPLTGGDRLAIAAVPLLVIVAIPWILAG